jgi:hypothetical protein
MGTLMEFLRGALELPQQLSKFVFGRAHLSLLSLTASRIVSGKRAPMTLT